MATADDLVRAGEEGRQRRGHGLGARVELGEGQGFSGVRNLQGREIGESRGGAAEDLRQPPHSLLMRDVHGVPAAEDIRQAVRAGVLLLEPAPCRPPRGTAATPRTSGPRKSTKTAASGGALVMTRTSDDVVADAQSKYRWSVPLRRMSRVAQWNPPPSIFACRSLSGTTSRPCFSRSLIRAVWSRSTTTRSGLMLKQVHVDPVAADALGEIVGIVPLRVLHGRAVDDLPLLQDRGQGIVD